MRILDGVNRARHSIRWQMLILFAFFSVLSTLLVACFAVAVLNVVIRRESAYFVEERINGIVDISRDITTAFANGVRGCDARAPDPSRIGEYASPAWPGSQRLLAVLPKGSASRNKPAWLDSDSFDGIIVDHGSIEIRSLHKVKRLGCSLAAVQEDTAHSIDFGAGVNPLTRDRRVLGRLSDSPDTRTHPST
jgi:hypothetical protein